MLKMKSGRERLKLVVGNQYRDLLELPVDEATIMFIENFRNGPTGDMINLLRACFDMEELDDFTFVWVVDTYTDINLMFDQELVSSGRIRVVAEGSYEYRRYLATSRFLFTERNFPQWYIKRHAQVVIRCAGPEISWDRHLFNRAHLQAASITANYTDYLVADDATTSYVVGKRSPACEDELRVFRDMMPRYDSFSNLVSDPEVVVAYSQAVFDKRWGNNPDAFYDWVRRAALHLNVDHDEFVINVPSKAMDLFDESSLIGYATVVRSIFGAIPLIRKARVVLTNNRHAFCMAQALGVHCVLLDAPSWAEDYAGIDLDDMGYSDYERFDNEYEALDAVSRYLVDGKASIESCFGVTFQDGTNNSEKIVEQVILGRGQWSEPAVRKGNRNLLLVRWKDTDRFHELLANRFNGVADTVLFMANTDYWLLDSDKEMFASSCITYRTGYHLGSDEERAMLKDGRVDELCQSIAANPNSFIHLEWRRILGNMSFDTVYAPRKHDGFWTAMLAFAPGNKVEEYKSIYELCSENCV